MVMPESIRIFETSMMLLIAENAFQIFLQFEVFVVYSTLNRVGI